MNCVIGPLESAAERAKTRQSGSNVSSSASHGTCCQLPCRWVDRLTVRLQIHEHGSARRIVGSLGEHGRVAVGRNPLRAEPAFAECALHPGYEGVDIIRLQRVVRQREKLAIQRHRAVDIIVGSTPHSIG
jgi:hypothetical protein